VKSDRRASTFSFRMAVVGILVSLVVLVSTVPARSQTETIPEGAYTGGIYLRVDSATLDLDGLGRLDSRADAAGEATIMVKESGSFSGTWTLEGTSVVGGTMSQRGVTGTLSANGVVTGSGTFFGGTTLDGRLTGATSTTGQTTFSGAEGGGITGPFNNTDSWDEPLTGLLVACSQLLARWDSELPEKLEAKASPGFQVNSLAAYIVLSDFSSFDEESFMADRLRDLAKRGNSLLGAARGGGDDMVNAIVDGPDLLRAVEALQAAIAAQESDCPSDKAFQNILTLIAQDALDAFLLVFESDDPNQTPLDAPILRALARLGHGTGALGSGARDTARAADLKARMEARANEAFEDALTEPFNENEAVSLAALGEQEGWSLVSPAGITGPDILAVTGN